MKNINWDLVYIFIFSFLFGISIGIIFKTPYTLGIKTFFHDIYVKLNPDLQKDSKTLIIERATKDTKALPQNSIFEEPQKKDNKFIIIIKRVFKNKEETRPSIHDAVIQ